MPVKRLLQFLLLAFPFSMPALAESNLRGDQIIVLPDTAASGSGDVGVSPSLRYLPDHGLVNDTTPAVVSVADNSPNLWQRIKDGYGMPELHSALTAKHESWYANRPDYIERMIARSQKYLFHIVEEVEKRGMPTEIALLPMVESAFNPQALSRSRASGIWQFMPATGKHFGLKQDWWVDNRRDVMAATDAALTYLQKLHVMFGTWELALAAYNAGEGTVMRAIEYNRKRGLPVDYASLALPAETRNYVPKLQAVKNIMTHPEQYGLQVQPIANQPYFIKVTAPQQIDAHLAAQLAQVSFDEFSALNPEYNRPLLTAGHGQAHEILLPVAAAEVFAANLANYDQPLVSWQAYQAKRGESTLAIAKKFGITLAQLREVNGLPVVTKLRHAQSLLVPSTQQNQSTDTGSSDGSPNIVHAEFNSQAIEPLVPASVTHKVKNGENLQVIAKRYRVSVKHLMAINGLHNTRIKTSQLLLINNNGRQPPSSAAAKKTIRYIVKRGDTLDSIARKFEVALTDLQRWNSIKGSHIVPGRKLTVFSADEA